VILVLLERNCDNEMKPKAPNTYKALQRTRKQPHIAELWPSGKINQ